MHVVLSNVLNIAQFACHTHPLPPVRVLPWSLSPSPLPLLQVSVGESGSDQLSANKDVEQIVEVRTEA